MAGEWPARDVGSDAGSSGRVIHFLCNLLRPNPAFGFRQGLFGDDVPVHRRQHRQQLVLRAERHVVLVHRDLKLLD
jgi:hypothetical protein